MLLIEYKNHMVPNSNPGVETSDEEWGSCFPKAPQVNATQ